VWSPRRAQAIGGAAPAMFHVELRQFPHNLCRFNLSEHELRAIAERWAREQWVALGDRKWDPNQARLTILEGPKLGPEQLTMGRGWRTAQRSGEDVTARVLADARARLQGAPAAAGAPPAGAGVAPRAADASPGGAHAAAGVAGGELGSAGAGSGGVGAAAAAGGEPGAVGAALWGGGAGAGAVGGEPGVAGVAPGSASAFPGAATAEGRELALHADSLGLELLEALSESALPLSRAWAFAHERFPGRAPSECLALAELALRSLLRRSLVEVVAVGAHGGARGDAASEAGAGAIAEAGAAAAGEGEGASRAAASGEALERVAAEEALARPQSWSGLADAASVWMRRA